MVTSNKFFMVQTFVCVLLVKRHKEAFPALTPLLCEIKNCWDSLLGGKNASHCDKTLDKVLLVQNLFKSVLNVDMNKTLC